MSSSRKSPERWVIERADNGWVLGTRGRDTDKFIRFNAGVPLTWPSLWQAQEGWLRFAVDAGYLKRGISLGHVGAVYHPGYNARVQPAINFVNIANGERVVVPEDKGELGIHDL